jgi:Anti-sigma-K factor rskA
MVPHCTPEQLALAALREPLPPADADHLAGCARCTAEVASLRRGAEALAVPAFASPVAPVAPPPSVWEAIAAGTGVTVAPRPDAVVGAPAPAPRPGPAREAAREAAPEREAEPEREPAEVVPLRRGRSRLLLAAAAALVVGAGIGGGAVVLSRSGNDGAVVAATALHPLDDGGATGKAAVVERDGEELLQVDLRAPTPGTGYYEVWLIDRSIKGMVPVGVVREGRTDLPLPAGIDLGEFPVVDVSVEALDGNPAHSGDSVARGQLRT